MAEQMPQPIVIPYHFESTREIALRYAVQTGTRHPEEVVRAAEMFEAFLSGKQAAT